MDIPLLKNSTMAALLLVLIISFFDVVSASVSDCKNAKADIVFLLDSSKSVTSSNFHLQKEFVANVSQTFDIGPRNVQIGVVTFATSPTEEFQLSTYSSEPQLLDAIKNIPYRPGSTGTGLGIYHVRTKSFSPSQGDRTDVPNILIVMTDGKSDNPMHTKIESQAVHGLNITVVAVGIGGDNIDRHELSTLASSPDNMFITQGFSALYSVYDKLLKATCSAGTGTSKGLSTRLRTISTKVTTTRPSTKQTKLTTTRPSTKSTKKTTTRPSTKPTTIKTTRPSTKPTKVTTTRPSTKPIKVTTTRHSTKPTTTTTTRPSTKPTKFTTTRPSTKSPKSISTRSRTMQTKALTVRMRTPLSNGKVTSHISTPPTKHTIALITPRNMIKMTINNKNTYGVITTSSVSTNSSTTGEFDIAGASAEKQNQVVVEEKSDSEAHIIVCAVLLTILTVLIVGQIAYKHIGKILSKKKSEVTAKPLDF